MPLLGALFLYTVHRASADGPADNLIQNVRPVPPPGIALSDAARQELTEGAKRLAEEIEAFATRTNQLAGHVADVRILHKAVDWAVRYGEFFKSNEVGVAGQLLRQGHDRLDALKQGQAPWTQQTGLVVRAYVSRIDDSVQPYGLVVPPSYRGDTPHRFRLDVWFHGRAEQLSELGFINERQKSYGEFTPLDTIVLHTYGRYCNGQKFAGETDLFEALAEVKKNYRIDDNRIVVRGFSLGGAACWHVATHHAWRWAAAAPGAGFSETPDFLKVFQNEALKPTWWEQKLWRLYDCPDAAINLFNVPTVAYSGEIDKQKQAADLMARALQKEGVPLVHIIGPQTGHKYHPDSKRLINQRIDALAARGRDPVPRQVKFTTYTLRYNKMAWVEVTSLGQHWERADIDARIGDDEVVIETRNVTGLRLRFGAGQAPFAIGMKPRVRINGGQTQSSAVASDQSWEVQFKQQGKSWAMDGTESAYLAKTHGLQGPMDDAFMESFVFVLPGGTSKHSAVGDWVTKESSRAIAQWRRHFRGDARVKKDVDVTEPDIAQHNLVLWGDTESNEVLRKISERLPIRWVSNEIKVGDTAFSASNHVLVAIYPNPLNPKKYVVLNSSFTFREYDYLNNARQTPKLPDFAVIDINTPPNARWPGRVVEAGFFDEQWRLPLFQDTDVKPVESFFAGRRTDVTTPRRGIKPSDR